VNTIELVINTVDVITIFLVFIKESAIGSGIKDIVPQQYGLADVRLGTVSIKMPSKVLRLLRALVVDFKNGYCRNTHRTAVGSVN
jgi:hypothetical protein